MVFRSELIKGAFIFSFSLLQAAPHLLDEEIHFAVAKHDFVNVRSLRSPGFNIHDTSNRTRYGAVVSTTTQ